MRSKFIILAFACTILVKRTLQCVMIDNVKYNSKKISKVIARFLINNNEMNNRDKVLYVFSEYVTDYDASDPKIRLKIDHTYRVTGLCETIAKAVGADKDIAWLRGIFRDIGRFEQVRRYNTFYDAKSVDHAGLSLEILFGEGLLDRFEVDLDDVQRRILEKAIGNHSLYRLEQGLSEIEQTYCNILRDADKIDIFRVNCDTPIEEIYNLTTKELKSSPASPEVKDCFRGQAVLLSIIKGDVYGQI